MEEANNQISGTVPGYTAQAFSLPFPQTPAERIAHLIYYEICGLRSDIQALTAAIKESVGRGELRPATSTPLDIPQVTSTPSHPPSIAPQFPRPTDKKRK